MTEWRNLDWPPGCTVRTARNTGWMRARNVRSFMAAMIEAFVEKAA